MPNRVDPARFTDMTFTRRKTFEHTVNDYVAVIDGLEVARFLKKTMPGHQIKWSWNIFFMGLPAHLQPNNGLEDSLEQAQDTMKEKFWHWQRFALARIAEGKWHL